MAIYKEKLTKEDFKIALNECFKKAWIWHSFENFQQALKWQTDQVFTYPVKEVIEDETDFKNDSLAIDLFTAYSQLQTPEQEEKLTEFINAWEDSDGFQITRFLGEQIEDGNEVGAKARELFYLKNQKESPTKKVFDFSENLNFQQVVTETQTLFQGPIENYSYLFEPAFSYDEDHLKTRIDVLKIKPNHHVEIIEIKATSKVKKEHFFDLAYQIFILEKNGLIVDNAYLGHLRDNFILGVPYNPNDAQLSVWAQQFYVESEPVDFATAKTIVDQLDFNQKFDYQVDDLEDHLEFFFEIDPYLKKESLRTFSVTLIAAYRELEKNGYLEKLLLQLTNLMALNFEQIKNYMRKNQCETRIKYRYPTKKKLGGWISDEQFCFHIVPWFDQSIENVFNFTGATNFSSAKKAQVYWQTEQVYLKDIPSLTRLNAELSEAGKEFFLTRHYRHFDIYKNYCQDPAHFDELLTIDGSQKDLKKYLKNYEQYPIYMYDFETAKWAVPRFNRSKAYQQIPFQYSIDVLMDEDFNYRQADQTIKHFDFLANEQWDPRPAFVLHFLKAIFSQGPGVYVAYNDAFEKTVLKYLAWAFPQFAQPLFYIVDHTIDLMNFFKGKKAVYPWFMVYHPLFHGSYSIKKTQPAFDPHFSYADLTVNRGDKASQIFRQYIDGLIPLELWKSQLRPDMIKYCNRDTLAMVVILQKVKEIFHNWELSLVHS